MWREIPLPKTVLYNPIRDAQPEEALRMKNIYFDGECLKEIEIYEMRGTTNMAINMSVPFNFVHNLPNRLIRFSDVMGNDVIAVASERSIQFLMQGSDTFDPKFVSSSEAQDQFADIIAVPPPTDTDTPTFVGVTDWSNNNFMAIVSTPNGLETTKGIVSPPQNGLVVAGNSTEDLVSKEVRYCYTYYNSKANIESNPSPPVSIFVNPRINENHIMVWGLEQQNSDFPSGVDKIRLYRFTEEINAFIRIAEINAEVEVADGWEYEDDKRIDYINTNYLSFDNGYLVNEDPDAAMWHIDRMYVGQGRILRYSNVSSPFSFGLGVSAGGTNILAGGYAKLTEPIIRLISWGSYLIIVTTQNVYKAYEENGFVFIVRFDVPSPSLRWQIHKVEGYLVIMNGDGLYIIYPDETIHTVKFNWKRFTDYRFKRKQKRIYPRLRKFYDRAYMEIEYIYENTANAEWGLEYLRIDLQNGFVSGLHTVDTFLGWGDR